MFKSKKVFFVAAVLFLSAVCLAATAKTVSASTDYNVFGSCWWKDSTSSDWSSCAKADFDGDNFIGPNDDNLFKAALTKYDLNGDGIISLATSTSITKSDYYDVFSLCWWKDSTGTGWSDCSKSDFDADNFIGPNDDNLFKAALTKYDLNGDGVVNTTGEEIKPDLTITNVSYTTKEMTISNISYTAIDFTVKFKNIGMGNVSAPFYVTGKSGQTKDYPGANGFFGSRIINGINEGIALPIKAGEEYTIPSVATYLLTKGESLNTVFTFGVDIVYEDVNNASWILNNNKIIESNENNNTFTKTVTIAGTETKPDLVVIDLKIDKAISSDPDTLKYIWVKYKNLGGAVAGRKVVKVKVTDSASSEVYYLEVETELRGGDSDTHNLFVSRPIQNLYSTHNLKAVIDPENVFSESNESNNAYSKTIMINGENNDSIISNLQVPDNLVRPTHVTVTWDTSIETSSFVYYVEVGKEHWSWQGQEKSTKKHSVKIPNLKPFTTYQYNVRAKDANGIIIKSETKEFTTTYDDNQESRSPDRYRHAKWECADGTHFEKEDGSSCKTEATWKNIAKNSCKNSEIKEFEVEKKCSDNSQDIAIEKIRDRAKDLFENKFEAMRAEINELRDIIKEQQTQIKYLVSLKKDVKELSEKVESAINNFITYGVDDNTKKLGAGERAAVMHSFKQAFNKLPETEEELSDAIKIANGRWPSMTSEEAEKLAKKQFEKIYKHIADMDNPRDNAAITVMAYGLRQKAENRNLESEKAGIKIFKDIYGRVPTSTEDWNIMQAITYSGASRGADTDGDLLLDEREIELGTDPKNPDTDGDGYRDGVEVANGFDPLNK